MEIRLTNTPASERRNMQIAEPLRTFTRDKSSPLKFERLKNEAQNKLSRHTTEVNDFRRKRSHWESTSSTQTKIPPSNGRKDTIIAQPEKVKIPQSPVEGKRSIWSVFKKGPPSRPADEHKTPDKNRHKSR